MFNKPKRNFRERRRDSESDEEGRQGEHRARNGTSKENGGGAQAPALAALAPTVPSVSCPPSMGVGKALGHPLMGGRAKENKASGTQGKGPVPPPNAMLSFVGEEEADVDVFQIKKPKTSKRVVRQLKKESQKEKEEEVTSNSVERSIAHNGTGRGAKPHSSRPGGDESSDGNSSGGEGVSESRGGGAADAPPSVQALLRSGEIPDAELIHLARKRRQRAREQGGDVIPLDSTIKYEGCGAATHASSRLIRDDDNDRSEDDSEGEVLAITSRQRDVERRRREEQILMAEEESASEGSDQDREWEEQQLRKGVCIPAQPLPSQVDSLQPDGYGYYNGATYQNPFTLPPHALSVYTPALSQSGAFPAGYMTSAPPPPPIDGQVVGIDVIKAGLVDRLAELSTLHRAHTLERDDLAARSDAGVRAAEGLRGRKGPLERQYDFFQATRGYVHDFVDCMNEKLSSIAFLERCMQQLYQHRADKFVKRRQEDIRDQSLAYTTGKAVPVVGSETEEIAKSRRRADREARRARRRRGREGRGVTDHNDGWSTDDEETSLSEATKFKGERERLRADVDTVMEDVVEDFSRYSLVLARFESWQRDFSDSYTEAYIGLCLPKLLTPLVRLELITWNPLETDCADYEDSRWFNALMFYGHDPDVTTRPDPNTTIVKQEVKQEPGLAAPPALEPPGGAAGGGDDLTLVPSVVDKLLLPKLTTVIESVWDPMSLQQTRPLSLVVRRLVAEFPSVCADSKNTQALVKAILARLNKSLSDDIFIPLYAKHVLESRQSEASIFFHRQFWATIKFLSCVAEWDGVLSPRHLKVLVLDSILNRYLVIAIASSPVNAELVHKCHVIASALPRDWFLGCASSDQTLPQLENFCRALVSCAKALRAQAPAGGAGGGQENRELVRQICKILVSIHATNHAVTLSDHR